VEALQKISLSGLIKRKKILRQAWTQGKYFPYVVVDDFLPADFAEDILAAFPSYGDESWFIGNYLHQKKQVYQTTNFPDPISNYHKLTSSQEFLDLVSEITGIGNLLSDPELTGGGLHQSTDGGFLDVHTDFNFHPRTKFHRRLNLLLYLNKDWKSHYEGYLEFWDMNTKVRFENISPDFNRAVIFATSEISWHGHPAPLNIPENITRKSLSSYYYTKEGSSTETAPEHNTIYIQTSGISGYAKTLGSAINASIYNAKKNGLSFLLSDFFERIRRLIKGDPPPNR
jgi:Rps23 Pro-64 3,4-dihydroxylase Tpa1-like proline 4-hydroxylase